MVRSLSRGVRVVGSRRVLPWLLAALFTGLAVALHLTVLTDLAVADPLRTVPLAVLLAAAVVAELAVLRVPGRRAVHALGLEGAVLGTALLTVAPVEAVAVVAGGCFLALSLARDSRPVQRVTATARALLSATTAATLFHTAAGEAVAPDPRALAAAVLAVLVAGLVGLAAAVASAAAEGEDQPVGLLMRVTAGTLAAGLAAGGLGAGAVVLLLDGGVRPVLLLLPAAGLLLLCGLAYGRTRRAAGDLAVVREAARTVAGGLRDERAGALLTGAVRALGVDRGELLLAAGPDLPERAYVHVAGVPDDESPGPLDAAGRAALEAVRAPVVLPRVDPGTGALADEADADLTHWVLARGYPDLAAAPVLVDGEQVGVLAVSGRRRGAPRLDRADADLLAALAEQVGVLLAASRVARRLSEAEASRTELEQRVFTDDLTGLARRPLFVDRVRHAASQRGATGSLAVLYLDLDDFKAVNDQLGHAAGDAVLVAVAHRITPLLRAGDTACRLGGDEFAVLLTGLDGADRASLVAGRLLDALREPVPVPGGVVEVRASVGIVVAQPGDDVASLLADADAAMYDAKRTGGNRWAAAEHKPADAARSNIALGRTQQVVSALSQPRLPGTLEVHYQPYVDLASGTVVGVEALVRWHHPDLGLLRPAEFLPVAERLGRMASLGREVLDSAVHQLARWDAAGAPPLRLNVNLSASQLRDPDLVESVEDALVASGLAPERLVLEVSESAVGQEPHEVVPVMALLAGRGVRWSLDGFGTGAVPLSRLDLLPLESVKIPAGMLADEDHPGRLGLTEGMVRLARSLGLRVVAEGVEREAQVVLLRGMRCDEAQGFHYGRPEPAGAGSPRVR